MPLWWILDCRRSWTSDASALVAIVIARGTETLPIYFPERGILLHNFVVGGRNWVTRHRNRMLPLRTSQIGKTHYRPLYRRLKAGNGLLAYAEKGLTAPANNRSAVLTKPMTSTSRVGELIANV